MEYKVYKSKYKGKQIDDAIGKIPQSTPTEDSVIVVGGTGASTYKAVSNFALESDIPTVPQNIKDSAGENSFVQKAPDGKENVAAMEGGVAFGKNSYANQKYDFALGANAIAGFTKEQFNRYYWDGRNPLHGGKGKDSEGNILDAYGSKYEDSFGYNFAAGDTAIANGREAVAFQQGKANGREAVAFHTSQSTGEQSFSIGDSAASGYQSFSQGGNTVAGYAQQAVFGRWNKNDENNIFEVGVGSGEPDPEYGLPETKNAFEITKDGYVKVANTPLSDNDVVRKCDVATLSGGAKNIKDGSGTSSINQIQDGTTGTFDFTDKNPNATALDPTLTGQIPYGGTGAFSTAFGGKSQASGKRSFAAGTTVIAKGAYSAAFGDNSVALGNDSFVEGYQNVSKGTASHAAGEGTQAVGDFSHSEGYQTIANGAYSKAEGYQTEANASHSHTEGYKTITEAEGSHAEGSESAAKGQFSHAEGIGTEAQGYGSHTEGQHTIVRNSLPSSSTSGSGDIPPADPDTYTGDDNNIGLSAHNEGWGNIAYGVASHAEGKTNIAYGHKSHAEGLNNKTGDISDNKIIGGEAAHAEGYLTHAKANYSHAEGHGSQALGEAAHAGGLNGYASGKASFAHGDSAKSRGDNSVAFGLDTVANADNSAAFGRYNAYYNTDILLSVGNGTSDTSRNNAFEVLRDGRAKVAAAPTENDDVVRLADLKSYIATNVTNVLNTEV